MLNARAPSRGMGGWRATTHITQQYNTKQTCIYSYMQVSCLVQTYARRHILGSTRSRQTLYSCYSCLSLVTTRYTAS